MSTFIDEIIADIDWRMSELATIKIIPVRYSFQTDHQAVYYKNAIPSIYALWEGFVKTSLETYSRHLNTLLIRRDEMSLALLTHHIDAICKLSEPRATFETKTKLVAEIDAALSDTIQLKTNLRSGSNVNLKVLNATLERYCIDGIDSKYKGRLDRLLKYRNVVAHGENSISVSVDQVNEFTELVGSLMLDVATKIDENERTASYLKKP